MVVPSVPMWFQNILVEYGISLVYYRTKNVAEASLNAIILIELKAESDLYLHVRVDLYNSILLELITVKEDKENISH